MVNNISVDKVSDNLSATIYPNPFSSSDVESYQVPKEGKPFVRIFDLNGKHIKQLVSVNLVSGEYLIDWDGKSENVRALTAGNYFLTVQLGVKIINKQIVKID